MQHYSQAHNSEKPLNCRPIYTPFFQKHLIIKTLIAIWKQ